MPRTPSLFGACSQALARAGVLRMVAAFVLLWAAASLALRWTLAPGWALALAALALGWWTRTQRTPDTPASEGGTPQQPPHDDPLDQPASTQAIPPRPASSAPPAPNDAPRPADNESLAYAVSHDLRAPIRVIEGFTRIVREDYGHLLDRVGNDHLERVLGAAGRMNQMIDSLLALARLSEQPLAEAEVDLSAIALQVIEELQQQEPARRVELQVQPGVQARGDATALRTVMENLLGNAWKYSARREVAHLAFGCTQQDGQAVYWVRDDGAGFDLRFAARLFAPFQRLHSASEFPGTGVGLASVQRIVRRHGGEIWADAAPDRGATFFFTLNPPTR